MKSRIIAAVMLGALTVLGTSACATKKYARNRINERVTPLEQRAGALEETSRRNSQELGRLNTELGDTRERADRAQTHADQALARADEANSRVTTAEQSVNDLRTNLDRFEVQNVTTVNFRFDRYDLTPEAKMALDEIASRIKDRQNFTLEIQGFADAIGSDTYNNQLTQRRADSVRRYLAEQHGIPLFRMHILGFGELRAVADNQTREGRAQNRRVEVRLLTRPGADSQAVQSSSQQ